MVDVEENLPVRDFPKYAGQSGFRAPLGPSVKVTLLQHGVDTSAGFDWDYLLAMWPLMARARTDWVRNAARPKAVHDREGHRAMIAKGGPAFLGIGFGEAQARINGACMFGARIQLPADIRLKEVLATLHDLCPLILDMAALQWPRPTETSG
jgi:hypothetical protein